MTDNDDYYPWYPDVIVLGPGGMKGFLELGALIKLHSVDYLSKVHTYIGCSVGALISLFLIAGYNPTEIVEDTIDADLFKDITTVQLNDVKENTGLISNNRIKERLNSRLASKFGFVPTLQQLYMATGIIYISVTLNLTRDRIEYLSKDTEPNLSCVEAASLSMNIPFLFYKLKYRGCIYIDGAFGNPYPIDICDDGKNNILGLYITSLHPENAEFNEENPLHYLYKVIQSSMTQIKLRIQKTCSEKCKHIELISPTMDTTGLSFKNSEKAQMLIIGHNEATKFLNKLIESDEDEDIPFYDESDSGALESIQQSDNTIQEIPYIE